MAPTSIRLIDTNKPHGVSQISTQGVSWNKSEHQPLRNLQQRVLKRMKRRNYRDTVFKNVT